MIASDKKVLNIFDIVLMTITSNFGIRWIAVAAGIGPSSLFFWLFGALFFFLPLAIITAQMARTYPDEGGLYAWTKRSMGEKNGFTVAWIYWVSNIFYYPAVLIFLSSNLAYVIGRPELASDISYTTYTALIGFWIVVFIGILGLKVSKYVVGLGGIFGAFIPATLLIIFAVLSYLHFDGSATNFTWNTFIPGGQITNNLSSLAMIMFAMAGVEVVATFANRVERPKRDLYAGLLLGALGIFVLYVLGTLAMNILAAPEEIKQTSGVVQAFAIINEKFHLGWFTKAMASCLSIAELAALVIWLLAPVIMFFKCSPRGILPDWMHKTDKQGTPVNAILFQGGLVSIMIVITSLLPSVNAMYQVLVLMATILYFIPYLYLAVAYVRSLPHLGIKPRHGYLLASAIFLSVLFGIVVSFFPSEDIKTFHDRLFYESELVLGPLLFIFIGWLLYKFRRKVS